MLRSSKCFGPLSCDVYLVFFFLFCFLGLSSLDTRKDDVGSSISTKTSSPIWQIRLRMFPILPYWIECFIEGVGFLEVLFMGANWVTILARSRRSDNRRSRSIRSRLLPTESMSGLSRLTHLILSWVIISFWNWIGQFVNPFFIHTTQELIAYLKRTKLQTTQSMWDGNIFTPTLACKRVLQCWGQKWKRINCKSTRSNWRGSQGHESSSPPLPLSPEG